MVSGLLRKRPNSSLQVINISDKHNCVGCGNCVLACPAKCVLWETDSEGFKYPVVNLGACLDCGACEKVCPMMSGSAYSSETIENKAYAAINKNEKLRMWSSSGGVFSALAMPVLADGGVVYGVAMDEFNVVRHIRVKSISELDAIRGSKYVQSELGNSFFHIREDLEKGIRVLFSGTPCQVKALYSFMGGRPEGLLTVEVICHGVSSPSLFKTYLEECGVSRFHFRTKVRGWENYDVELLKKNGRIKREKASENLFMRGYIQNWMLRPSCYKCPAKGLMSGADLTIGDFWGVRKILPYFFDDTGVSLTIVHTSDGAVFWEEVKNGIDRCMVYDERYLDYNPSVNWPSSCPAKRGVFFKEAQAKRLIPTLRRFTRTRKTFKVRLRDTFRVFLNVYWTTALKVRELYYNSKDTIRRAVSKTPVVLDVMTTLDHILYTRCSVARFGDGEMKFIEGGHTWFQGYDPSLATQLKNILMGGQPNLAVCVPDIFGNMDSFSSGDRDYWRKHIARNRGVWYRFMDRSKPYYDAFISRCYMPFTDKSKAAEYFDKWKKIWSGRDILLVEGENTRFGVGNDLLSCALSVRRILAPNTGVYSLHERLLEEVKKYGNHHLVLIALGPTATVMASELAALGYQAIDVGHLDIEYEWFRMGAKHKVPIENKFVNEAGAGTYVGDLQDDSYKSEIVCHF